MKKIIIPISTLLITGALHAQLTQGENYIKTKIYLDYNGNQASKSSETVEYLDGLGRPKQIVNVKASPLGKDVVTHLEYDQFGRHTKDFLPVPQTGTHNGGIVSTSLANATIVYGGEKIYSEKIIENSPLERIRQQIQVGNDWANKPVSFTYETNVTGEVRKMTTTTTFIDNATRSTLEDGGTFTTGQLYKNTTTDEDGNQSIEFKNGKGQVILVRRVINSSENADTYYVYNEFDQLAWVIPPLLSKMPAWSPADLAALAYEYRYDNRNRLVEKKLPGKGLESMVYDKAGRLILSQDINMKTLGNWLVTKYDLLGRIIYSGILKSNDSRATMQNQIANLVITENRDSSGFAKNGMNIYYTNKYIGISTILSVNYYDTYPQQYIFNPPFPTSIQGEPVLTDASAGVKNTKGLPVMNMIKNIDDDNWTKSYTYYDTKGRLIGTHSINHLGGYTIKESKLDFSGIIKQTVTRHKRLNTDHERVVTETFEYDHQNRLLVHQHKVDNNPVEILAQNTYNEISQISNKKVGNNLQSIDFKYNIRGWMTQINDPENLNGKLFGYKVKFSNPTTSLSPRYNGNIAEIDWATSREGTVLKRYSYQYDSLNRMIKGNYSEPQTTTPENHYFDEELSYDVNGNIKTLKRFAKPSSGTTPEKIDDLIYNYENNNFSNKLLKVTLPSNVLNNKSGYNALEKQFSYDDNGNMISHLDVGKEKIAYNYLNLISETSAYNGNEQSHYFYRADGIKIGKTENLPFFIKYKKTTDYLDGFQYETVDYAEKYPAGPHLSLKFIPTTEGYYNFENNTYIYNYIDHLGNIRLSYKKTSNNTLSGTEILDEKNYYPLGLSHSTFSNEIEEFGPSYNYGYNGQEFQPWAGMIDFGARLYIPQLGRWSTIDPLSETSRRWSPYTYAYNNPIRFIDPDGMENQDWVQRGNQIFFDPEVTSQEGAVEKYGENAQHLDEGSTVTSVTDGQPDGEFTYTLHDNGTVTDANGNIMDNTQNIQTRNLTIFSNCSDCLDPGTLFKNIGKMTYPGGDNPLTYGGKFSYEYAPSMLSEYPAIGHDRRYDNLKVTGLMGLLTDTRAIGADYRFVGEELLIAATPFVGIKDRMTAAGLGVGLGLLAAPKTVFKLVLAPTSFYSIYQDYKISNEGVTNQPKR